MTENELKKLSRAELLALLIDQMKENESLEQKASELEQKLSDRRIELEQAGSIAEAAMKINGVFEAAQAAASQYLENISRVQNFAKESANVAASRAEKMLVDAQQEAQKIIMDAQQEAQKILVDARCESVRIRSEAVSVWNSFTGSEGKE